MWTEDFSGGLSPYTVQSGNGALFTLASTAQGTAMHAASSGSGSAWIQRAIPTPEPLQQWQLRMRLRSRSTDQSNPVAYITDAAQSFTLTVAPSGYDLLFGGKPIFALSTSGLSVPYAIAAAPLAVDDWVAFDVVRLANGNRQATLRTLAGTVLGSVTVTGVVYPADLNATHIGFISNNTAQPSVSEYAQLIVNPGPVVTDNATRVWPAGEPQ